MGPLVPVAVGLLTLATLRQRRPTATYRRPVNVTLPGGVGQRVEIIVHGEVRPNAWPLTLQGYTSATMDLLGRRYWISVPNGDI